MLAGAVPVKDAGDAGHVEGLTAGSVMQTSPVAPLTCGIARGTARATRNREVKARSFLGVFKKFSLLRRSMES